MNRLSSQNRKFAYLGGIVVLLICSVLLGLPGDGTDVKSGGLLTQQQAKYELGETSLGNVDPASSTMNLVLLGLRGVATNVLWQQAIDHKEKKNWGELRATVDSIVLLQPHFRQVWEFQGWNLAYNVSAEWDGVADRYHWVKEGAKFMIEGTRRNVKYPELYWETGRITGQKVGRSDEWRIFRDYFLHDPEHPDYDTNFPPDHEMNSRVPPDQTLNPEQKDNYLVSKEWFIKANEVEALPGIVQHKEDRMLFRGKPVTTQMSYADALQREGIFDELSREAWAVGNKELREVWGKEPFESPGGTIVLEADQEIIEDLAKEDGVDVITKRNWIQRYQNKGHYRYWRLRSQVESQQEMMEAHRDLYNGKQAYLKRSDTTEGYELLKSGMEKMDNMLRENPGLAVEDTLVEECVKAVIMWQSINQILGIPLPETYPLKRIYDEHPEDAQKWTRLFRAQYGGGT